MRFGMVGEQTGYQISEIRREAARCRHARPATDEPAGWHPARRGRRWLRSRVAFTLIETGLRLLPAPAPQPRG